MASAGSADQYIVTTKGASGEVAGQGRPKRSLKRANYGARSDAVYCQAKRQIVLELSLFRKLGMYRRRSLLCGDYLS
jgi:hypothetical protein